MQHVPRARFTAASPPRHARLFELIRQENLAGRNFRPKRDEAPHPILCANFIRQAEESLRPQPRSS
ncbi:hypothetical protein [Shimia biformata]|uniref:hypothetical protein n=1 Tax=Shimia biformata TaxID=1294299 RepID=UPI00195039BE|nr:hypothetical protein [Shimia biformata]